MLPSLLQTLETRWSAPVRLVWTDNRSVYLSLRRQRPGGWVVRLHRCFEEAPPAVWRALERFLLGGRRSDLAPLRAFFGSRSPGEAPRRRAGALSSRGRVHDLGELLDELRGAAPFGGLPPVEATWGRGVRPGLRTIRLGSYLPGPPGEAHAPALVRLHRVLDRAEVPRAVVAQVLHHELVHHYLSSTRGPLAGRRHGREFRALEESFPLFERALAWQRLHLPAVIRAERRQRSARKERAPR